MEAERLSAEVTPAKSEDDEKVLPMEEAVDCSQERKRIEQVTAGKKIQALKWKEVLPCVKLEENNTLYESKQEKKSGDTCGISGDAGLRFGAVRGLRNLVKKKLTNSALFRAQ